MRAYNLKNQKGGNNGISIIKILRKSVGHDFTHLNKSSWKLSFI